MSAGHTTPSYKPLGKPRKSKGKGAALPQDAMLTSERDCYARKVARDKAEEEAKEAAGRQEEEEIAQGCVFECGCCFDEAGMSRAIQCMEAHLFCIDCARKNAEHTLGNRGCVSNLVICGRKYSRHLTSVYNFARTSLACTKMGAPRRSLMMFYLPS